MRRWLIGLVLFGVVMRLAVGSVPAMVLAATVVGRDQGLPVQDGPGPEAGILTSLLALMGAEARALQVAGKAIEQPTSPGLADEATAAGEGVRRAVEAYVRSVEPILSLPERLLPGSSS